VIKIIQGQQNELHLTLDENQTLSYPSVWFLFEFIKEGTGEKFYSICTDNTADASYRTRFNHIDLLELPTSDPTASEITLPYTGTYTYNVYEQTSNTNLNPANANKLLETGLCKVYAATTYRKTFTGTNTGKTFTL
jgi:hypothetical protein